MSFRDVMHQPQALRQVQRALSRERVPHAYIFHGPEGVGKELFARGMAEYLLCATPTQSKPDLATAEEGGLSELLTGCGKCDDCRSVAASVHPDLHFVYRQLNRQHSEATVRARKGLELGVDVVREFLIDKVARTPQRGRAKVFIIREADLLNVEAQNALLKTLEEPPGATYLILLSVGLDYLLPTTQSRCQVVRFQALPDDFVREKLRELRPDVAAQQLGWYAAYASGSVGEGLQAVDDQLFELASQLAEVLSARKRKDAGLVAKFLTDESKKLGEQFSSRDPEITDTEAARRGLKALFRISADHYARAIRAEAAQAKSGGLEGLAARIERIAQAEQQLDRNASVALVVETLAHELVES